MPGEQRKMLLVKHALGHFASHGFHATSMQDIANSAGITKPVIYQHFRSKRALYLDLLDMVGTDLCEQIRLATEECESGHQRVMSGFYRLFFFAHENRSGYELLFANPQRQDHEFRTHLFRIESEVAELVTSQIAANISDSHRRFLALGVISLAEGTVRRWLGEVDEKSQRDLPFEATSGPQSARRVAELAWNGLRGIQRDDTK